MVEAELFQLDPESQLVKVRSRGAEGTTVSYNLIYCGRDSRQAYKACLNDFWMTCPRQEMPRVVSVTLMAPVADVCYTSFK